MQDVDSACVLQHRLSSRDFGVFARQFWFYDNQVKIVVFCEIDCIVRQLNVSGL